MHTYTHMHEYTYTHIQCVNFKYFFMLGLFVPLVTWFAVDWLFTLVVPLKGISWDSCNLSVFSAQTVENILVVKLLYLEKLLRHTVAFFACMYDGVWL